jgi:3',5'-cyclic AMP phosphodiesterase CpdA
VRYSFTLAHLSDPHVGPLPKARLNELMSKRLSGYWNWHRGRNRFHDMPTLKILMADVVAQKPDHIALTGDIVNIGLPSEFTAARHTLAPLGGPDHVSIIPGNHDAYVSNSYPAMEASFGAFMRGDDMDKTEFPFIRMRNHVALIGLSSGVPTLPLLASGKVGEAQLKRLANLLDASGGGGLIRVLMIHHPPVLRGTTFGRGLTDASAFEAVLQKHGAELVIHGHNHTQSVNWIHRRNGPSIPVIGVASASAVPGTPKHRAAYHLYRFGIEGEQLSIDMITRSVTEAGAMEQGPVRRLVPKR